MILVIISNSDQIVRLDSRSLCIISASLIRFVKPNIAEDWLRKLSINYHWKSPSKRNNSVCIVFLKYTMCPAHYIFYIFYNTRLILGIVPSYQICIRRIRFFQQYVKRRHHKTAAVNQICIYCAVVLDKMI